MDEICINSRKEFEGWARDHKFILRLDETTNDDQGRQIYSNVMTQGAWMAWEAAADRKSLDRDAVITLLFACEEAMESVQNRPKPADQEEAGMREKILEDVEIVHSMMQEAFCGEPSICDSYHIRH